MARCNIEEIGVAVDLGSTTIAIQCFDMNSKDNIGEITFPNPQYRYGADVITRIRHCIDEPRMADTLKSIVWDAIFAELERLLGEQQSCIATMVISGNTTMQHLLRGLSVQGLAYAPFEAVTLDKAVEHMTVFGKGISVVYPPGLSAFVGADILTGAAYLQMGQTDVYDLLVDLGTNGELLLLNRTRGYAASTACGPVFDHAISGAVYGSESIHAIASCIKRKLIDHNGVIREPFFEKGIEIDKGFVIHQQNVRNFQLAKGAIYSGICCLADEAGISFSEIGNIYISGGFGFYMDVRDAFTVGLLPKEWRDKITVSGNSSLKGAAEFLFQPDTMQKRCEEIISRTTGFELADLPQFEKRYVQALNF